MTINKIYGGQQRTQEKSTITTADRMSLKKQRFPSLPGVWYRRKVPCAVIVKEEKAQSCAKRRTSAVFHLKKKKMRTDFLGHGSEGFWETKGNFSTERMLLIRAASLFILLILFQVLMAQVQMGHETKRRLQHALTGHCMVQVSYFLTPPLCFGLLLIAAIGMCISQRYFLPQFQATFGPLLRPQELSGENLPGAFYFLLGTAITVGLVDMEIARYAVECLAIADPVASWIGSSIPSTKLSASASVSGCFGCFASALLVGWIMLPRGSVGTWSLGALACTLAEALPYGNDNFNIPVITALVVQNVG